MTTLPVASVSRRWLLTSLALVFCYLKVTENRGREENGCSAADEPQRQPAEAGKVVQKVLTEVAAAGFTEEKSLTTTASSLTKRLLACRVL